MSEDEHKMDIEELPTKPSLKGLTFQYGAAFSASLSAMVAGVWLAWPSPTIKPLTDGQLSLKLTSSQVTTLVSLMDLGNVLSPIPSSYLMDIMGRKPTLLITAALYIIASVCTIFGNHVGYLYTARILAGLGKGVAFAVVPIFLAEVANKEIRGAISTMFTGFLYIGSVYDYVLGPFISYNALNLLNLIPPILFAVTFWFIPESPYYLTMKGKQQAAIKSLAKFRWAKTESVSSEFKIISKNVEKDMANKARFIDLFLTKGNRKALIIISLLAIFQRLSGISPTLAYSTSIMPSTGGGVSPSIYMIFFSVILAIANYVATPLVDNLGRKPLLIISTLSSAVVMGVAGLFYYFDKETSHDMTNYRWIPYACLIIFGITYSLGIGFLPSTLVGELFPLNVKSYAGSISAILLAATSFSINKMFQAVSENYGLYTMYAIFTGSCLIATLFIFLFVFETKGKSFDEIQEILNKKKVKNEQKSDN